jgi:hypothetical protein
VESRVSRLQGQEAGAGSQKLYGQRQSVEAAAELGHRRGVGVREPEGGVDGPGALDEEDDGRGALDGGGIRVRRGGRRFERLHDESLLSPHP